LTLTKTEAMETISTAFWVENVIYRRLPTYQHEFDVRRVQFKHGKATHYSLVNGSITLSND